MSNKCLKTSLSPFIETFKKRQSKSIFQAIVLCHVVDRIASKHLVNIICLSIEVSRCFISFVYTTIVAEVYRVNETCNRHIFVLNPCSVFLCFFLCSYQTVGSCLSINRNALTLIILLRRLVSSNDSIVRTTSKNRLVINLSSFLLSFLLCFFSLFFFLCFNSKFLCLNLIFRHRYLTVET